MKMTLFAIGLFFHFFASSQITTYHFVEFYESDLQNPKTREPKETKAIISTDADTEEVEIIIDGTNHPVVLVSEKRGKEGTTYLYKSVKSHPQFGEMMFLFAWDKTEDSLSIYFDGKTGTIRYSVY